MFGAALGAFFLILFDQTSGILLDGGRLCGNNPNASLADWAQRSIDCDRHFEAVRVGRAIESAAYNVEHNGIVPIRFHDAVLSLNKALEERALPSVCFHKGSDFVVERIVSVPSNQPSHSSLSLSMPDGSEHVRANVNVKRGGFTNIGDLYSHGGADKSIFLKVNVFNKRWLDSKPWPEFYVGDILSVDDSFRRTSRNVLSRICNVFFIASAEALVMRRTRRVSRL